MKLQTKDYEVFLAKLTEQGNYEKRSEPTLDGIAGVLNKITEAVTQNKERQEETIRELRGQVDRLETKLARPGAFTSVGGQPEQRLVLKTAAGVELPCLTREQKLADFHRSAPSDEFSLGDYARAAVLGAPAAKAQSGPAFVPMGLTSVLIDKVRAQTVISQAGARTIVIDGPASMARLTQDPTVFQHDEGAGDVNESDLLAVPVTLNPRTLAALVPLTQELVSDSPNLDAALQTAIAGAFAAKLDALCLATLLADTAIPKSGVAQDPASWQKTLEAVGTALGLNQALPPAHISAPADFIARAGQLASDAGTWLGKPPALSAMRELFTTTLNAGTAFFGDFENGFGTALRQELRIEVVRFAKPESVTHLLIAHMRADGIVLQPARLFKQLKSV